MTEVRLRSLHSPDVPNLQTYTPDNPENFCILVQAFIGPVDKAGEESFDFLVSTPSWLSNQIVSTDYIWGKHILFLSRYDYGLLWRVLSDLCDQAKGLDWDSVAQQLGRYGKWEFEDYKSVNKM